MKIEVAHWTEWAWSEGIVSNPSSRIAFSAMLLDGLKKRYPKAKINSQLALAEIDQDVQNTLRKLSYGGRKPTDIHPVRRKNLQASFK